MLAGQANAGLDWAPRLSFPTRLYYCFLPSGRQWSAFGLGAGLSTAPRGPRLWNCCKVFHALSGLWTPSSQSDSAPQPLSQPSSLRSAHNRPSPSQSIVFFFSISSLPCFVLQVPTSWCLVPIWSLHLFTDLITFDEKALIASHSLWTDHLITCKLPQHPQKLK